MNSREHDEWVVILEFVPPNPHEPFAYRALHALVEETSVCHPVALFSTDRYALQLRVAAARPADALRRGLDLHDRAVLTVGLGRPVLVRTEVVTGPEFDSEWDDAAAAGGVAGAAPGAPHPTDTVLCAETYLATRAILQSSTASELTDILVSFVHTVGGQVRSGPGDGGPGQLTVDLALEDGPSHHAVVESLSVAGLIIEESLPALVADARAALRRLSRRDSVSDQRPGPMS
jgi:hypothetical protein